MKKLSSSPRAVELLYGENPSQRAMFVPKGKPRIGIQTFETIGGISLSANNVTDINRGLLSLMRIMAHFGLNIDMGNGIFVALTIKHSNVWAAGLDTTPESALKKMIESNPEAVFGGVVITNFKINADLAELMVTHQSPAAMPRVFDVVVAPAVDEKALARLERKKSQKCRVLVNPILGHNIYLRALPTALEHKQVLGGEVVQEPNRFVLNLRDKDLIVIEPARQKGPTNNIVWDLLLAVGICATTTSNTVTIVKNGMLLGNGMGQGHRGLSTRIALMVAKDFDHDTRGSVVVSDSFYPALDGPRKLIEAKAGAVFAPSGSVMDKQVQDLLHHANILLYTMPYQKCRMFFGH